MSNKDKQEIFICECGSREHMVIVGIDDYEPTLYMEVTANQYLPWYKRIWPAVKYLFGQPTLQWDDVLLKKDDVARLQSLIDEYKRMGEESGTL